MNKKLATIGAVLGTAAGAIGLGYYFLLRRPLPKKSGALHMDGLMEPVEIQRDRWGVPHIYAQNAWDLMFAQGYIHAQDRLWQMDFNRRLVAGRLAEILGKVAVPLDGWMRILGMRRVSEKEINLINSETRAALEAYAAGVNARIQQDRLPVEFNLLRYQPEPWSVADSLSWSKMMAWTLSVNWESELLRARLIAALGPELAAELEPESGPGTPRVVPPGVPYSCIGEIALERAEAARKFTGPSGGHGLGSNNWVISGKHTSTGKPILANDMHLSLTIPSIWYENHLMGGDLNVTGVSFPGIPGIIAGHNEHVAWGFTNGFPDVQDLYMEELRRNEDGSVQAKYQGEWEDARVHREIIRVKGGTTSTQEVIVTRHGPVINALSPEFIGEQPLALRWTALEPDNMYDALYKINRAHNCIEFREALRFWSCPTQNTVYADTDGNIGYSFPGKIPIRAKGDGRVPVPGWSGEYEWIGYIPFEELPHLYNPPQGYIVTANNRVVGEDYPYFLGYDCVSGNRARRITELIENQLKEGKKIDQEYIRKMHFDQVSPAARTVGTYIGKISVDDPELVCIVADMAKWDGHLAVDSSPAVIYETFVRMIIRQLLSDKLGDLAERYMGKGPTPVLMEGSIFSERAHEWLQKILGDPNSTWFDLGKGETRDEIMRIALRESVVFLKKELGPDPAGWTWGKLHKIKFAHTLGQVKPLDKLFNRGPFPLGGDGDTVWATGSSTIDFKVQAVVGPPFRFIADLADLDQSLGLLAPGQSGQPASPHYADNIQAWFSGGYHRMAFSKKTVETVAVSKLLLEPVDEIKGKRNLINK